MPTETAVTKPEPTVRYLSGRPREIVVKLEEPVEVDGVTYTSFTVRKLAARDLDAYFDTSEAERAERPMANVDITGSVLAVLDADDVIQLRETSLDFLPRSWRTVPEPTPASAGLTPSISDDGLAKGSNAASIAIGSTS